MYNLARILAFAAAGFGVLATLVDLLWKDKTLHDIIFWRTQLEKAVESGTIYARNYWKHFGLPIPIGAEKIKSELTGLRQREAKRRRLKKVVLVILSLTSGFFLMLAIYCSLVSACVLY